MGYEIFQRDTTRITSPAVTLTPFGRIGLNAAASRVFEKNAVEYVLLLWDSDLHMVGIRPITKRDTRAYKVSYGKRHDGAGISAKSFLDHIGANLRRRQTLVATWNEQEAIFEFALPEQKADKQPKLVTTTKRQAMGD
jgi:hypothetical protein